MGFIMGLVVGLGLSLAVAIYVTKVPTPFSNKNQPRSSEQDKAEKNRAWAEAEANPVVRAVLDTFSGAKIIDIRDLAEVAAAESAAVADDGETPDFMVQQQDDGVYYPLDDEGEY